MVNSNYSFPAVIEGWGTDIASALKPVPNPVYRALGSNPCIIPIFDDASNSTINSALSHAKLRQIVLNAAISISLQLYDGSQLGRN